MRGCARPAGPARPAGVLAFLIIQARAVALEKVGPVRAKLVKRVGLSRRPVLFFSLFSRLILSVPHRDRHVPVASAPWDVRTLRTHHNHWHRIASRLPRDRPRDETGRETRRRVERDGGDFTIRYFFITTRERSKEITFFRAETPRSACADGRRRQPTRASRVSRLRLAPRVARRRCASPAARPSPRPSEGLRSGGGPSGVVGRDVLFYIVYLYDCCDSLCSRRPTTQ